MQYYKEKIMSVYSGFASRTQESAYNRSLYNLLCLLQMKVTKSLKGEEFDDSQLSRYFQKFYARLAQFDEYKYLAPKFSVALKDLAQHFGCTEYRKLPRPHSIASISSNQSFQQFQQNYSTSPQPFSSEPRSVRSKRPNFRIKSSQLTEKELSPLKPRLKDYEQRAECLSKPPPRFSRSPQSTINNNNIIITINRSFNVDKKKGVGTLKKSELSQPQTRKLNDIDCIYHTSPQRRGGKRLKESRKILSPLLPLKYQTQRVQTVNDYSGLRFEQKGYREPDFCPEICSGLEVIKEGVNDHMNRRPGRRTARRIPKSIQFKKFIPIIQRSHLY